MFTKAEIDLMQKIGLKFDFEHPETLSSEDWVHVSDVVEDQYVLKELYEVGDDYQATPDGVLCEDILEKLARKEPT